MLDIELPQVVVDLTNFISDRNQGQIEFPINVDLNYAEERFVVDKSIIGKVKIEKVNEKLWLHFAVKAEIKLICDRCLKKINKNLSLNFDRFVNADAEEQEIILTDNKIDLFSPILDEIILKIPAKILCKHNCRGFCPNCGVNLNLKSCNHYK